jgi:cytochrome oxidase Cu insertion factor (SCO1/SenC/PrrC family)
MKRRRLAGVASIVLLAVGGAAVALAATGGGSPAHGGGPRLRADAVWRPGSRPAPDFRLHDQHGRLASLASFRGRPFLLVFLDSKCRTLCPIVGRQLGDAERMLGATPARLVTISVDQGDSPASVRAAARHWRWRGDWTWLMGHHAQLSAAWKAYGISVRPTAADITHSLAVFLIDANGNERAGFLPPLDVHDVVRDVRMLQREAARNG